MNNLILEVKNITKEVNSPEGLLTIVKDINLSVEQGKPVSLVGPSGSGKTTLLAIMAGLDLPTAGTVRLLGSQITSLDEDKRAQIRGKDVGFVFQSFELLPSLTALENVMLPSELKSENDPQQKGEYFLDRVGLTDRKNHYPNQLSGGEQQRVAIARAFACSAKILFADEPTGNLDPRNGKLVSDLLFEVNSETDNALVIVTHDQDLASQCDKKIELKLGKIVD